jgi:hypothetical protein
MIETMYDGQFGACAAVGPATNAAVKALLKREGKTVSATISELEAQPARSPSPPTDAQ